MIIIPRHSRHKFRSSVGIWIQIGVHCSKKFICCSSFHSFFCLFCEIHLQGCPHRACINHGWKDDEQKKEEREKERGREGEMHLEGVIMILFLLLLCFNCQKREREGR